MFKATRLMLLVTLVVGVLAALSYVPGVSSQGRKNTESGASGRKETTQGASQSQKKSKDAIQKKDLVVPTIVGEDESEEGERDDPDLPPGMAGRIDKESYLRARADYINLLRGDPSSVPSELRTKAISQMEKQEAAQSAARSRIGLNGPAIPSWTFLGPAPIPLGQTSTTRVPVSGRTIAIAVHPTDPNIVYVGTAQGGLYKSINGGTTWTALFDSQMETLAIGAITIDPTDSSIVYLGTGEPNLSADSFAGRGLYIIRNANSPTPTLNGPFRLDASSNDVFTGRAIGRIMVNPLDNNVIFLCTTSGSGGNPNTTPATLPPRGLYRSLNAQSSTPTFQQIQITGIATPNDRSTVDIQLDPSDPNLLIATVIGATSDGGVYRTANALDATPTFTRTLVTPDGSTNGRAELTATRNGTTTTFYVATGEISSAAIGGPACAAGTAGLLRRSVDLGLTWSTPLPGSTGFCGGQCFYDMAIAVTPDNQTIHLGGAARGGSGQCLIDVRKRSTNGGTSFARNDNTLHADEHALAIAPSNPQIVYTGSDGGIWKSINNGDTWTQLNNSGFSATQFQGVAQHPYDRYFLMGGTQDNGTNCLAPDGVTWSHCQDGDGGYAIIDDNAQDTTNLLMYHTFFNQTNNQIGYERATSTAANANGIFSWTFRGCSGTTSNNGFRCADNVLFYAPMAQGPANPNTLYFGTDRLYRSSNRGDAMVLVSQGPLVPSTPAGSGVVVTTIGISPQDDNVRIVGLRTGQVFATVTGSSVMTNVTGANFPPPNPADPLRNSIGRAVIDPNNKFTAYVTFTSFSPPAGQQIFKTTNLNDPTPSWTPASNGIPTVPISSLAVDPQNSNILYAGTDIGVYQSLDGGANWAPYGTGLPRVAVFDVKISDVQRVLRIATHGRGIWEIGIPGRQLPVVRSGGASLVAESCANGVIDPSENVTVRFGVSNIGAGPTLNLVVTLLATGGVVSPSGPEVYGAVDAGTTATRDFQFTNNSNCGDTITLTFHLQDGATDLGNFSFPFTLGSIQASAPSFTENFDGVTAPALPAGWVSTKTPPTGNPVLWATNATLRDTLPNSAFSAGSTTAGESRLDSPVIPIPNAPLIGASADVRLQFKTLYNTEPGFDGGILEISINGGAFQEIVAAGGSFIEGGYNGVIDPTTDSTIAGRQAWTGNSGGFITTTVKLPPSSYGQNAQFRWRAAYDTGTSPAGGGLRIDTISLFTSTRICCLGSAVSNLINESCPPDNNLIDPGERVTVNLGITNNGPNSTTNLVATLLPTGGVLAPTGPQSYGAMASGASAGFDFAFTADPALTPGQTLVATLQLQDGATNLGTAVFNFTVGPTPCAAVRLAVTSSLVRTSPTNVRATINIQNTGSLVPNNLVLTTARLGSTNGTVLPQSLGPLEVGATRTTTVDFTNSTPGANALLVIGGTYIGGNYGSTSRVVIP
jgi:photosystem II stability/assembly factor-like uncharacterized protein